MLRNFLTAIALAGSAIQANASDLKVLVPQWLTTTPGFEEIASDFQSETSKSVEFIAIPGDASSAQFLERALINDEVDMVFGWRADSALVSKLEGDNPRFVPDWVDNSAIKFSTIDDSAAARMVVLGAGWKGTKRDSQVIYSIPAGENLNSWPLLVARPVANGGVNPDGQANAQSFFNYVGQSSKGRALLEALTGLPALAQSQSPGVKIMPRPNAGDDGCGCDDHATCNPDGLVVSEFSFDSITSNSYLPQPYAGLISDNDGCGCENNRVRGIHRFLQGNGFALESGQLHGTDLFNWQQHVDLLQAGLQDGDTIFVQSCNPD